VLVVWERPNSWVVPEVPSDRDAKDLKDS
jgi:hypothetical protein